MSAELCPCCGRPNIKLTDAVLSQAKLTPSESTLFRAIARGKGEAVPFEMLYGAIWGQDPNGGPDSAENVIRRHVSVIRGKVAAFGFGIAAVYGFGYRLTTIIAEAA